MARLKLSNEDTRDFGLDQNKEGVDPGGDSTWWNNG